MPYLENANDEIYSDLNYDFNSLMNFNSEEPNDIEIRLAKGQIITISDCSTKSIPDPPAKYVGKFLSKIDNNMLVLGVCAEKRKTDIEYAFGDIAAVSYILLRSLYSFSAEIANIREVAEEDGFDTGDMLGELTSVYGYNNYIFEVVPQTLPEKQQRREFFRMPLKVDIYYKLISENDFAGIKTPYIKFDPEKAKEIKQEADAGLLETDKGYSKLSTTDISAGGFKCKHHIKIDVDTYLQCMLIINDEALPLIARAIGSQPDETNPRLYDLRASFDKISDTVRDRIVKYIFYQQRQLQAKFLKRRF